MLLQEMRQPRGFFRKKEKIAHWLHEHFVPSTFEINDDLSVDVDGDVDLRDQNLKIIPVKFNRIYGYFSCAQNDLKDASFAPKYVQHSFFAWANPLTSFSNFPSYIGNTLSLLETNINSLHNIHMVCKHVGGKIMIPSGCSHLLGIFLIKGGNHTVEFGIKASYGKKDKDYDAEQKDRHLADILNKHLRSGDIHTCQEELLDLGFIKEAKV